MASRLDQRMPTTYSATDSAKKTSLGSIAGTITLCIASAAVKPPSNDHNDSNSGFVVPVKKTREKRGKIMDSKSFCHQLFRFCSSFVFLNFFDARPGK